MNNISSKLSPEAVAAGKKLKTNNQSKKAPPAKAVIAAASADVQISQEGREMANKLNQNKTLAQQASIPVKKSTQDKMDRLVDFYANKLAKKAKRLEEKGQNQDPDKTAHKNQTIARPSRDKAVKAPPPKIQVQA